MVRLLDSLVRRAEPDSEERLLTPGSFGLYGGGVSARPDIPDTNFVGYISGIHHKNGVVAAAVEARALLMSQLRFRWRRLAPDSGLWGNRDLSVLEQPAGLTRPGFLHQLEIDASYAGSAYVVRRDGRLRRLRPDRCSVMLGSDSEPDYRPDGTMSVPFDAEILALMYNPNAHGPAGGYGEPNQLQTFLPGEFAIWSPEPDPLHFWRGSSWVTSVMREIVNDGQASDHTSQFLTNGTVPGLVFLMDPSKTPEETREYARVLNENHAEAGSKFKNMFLGGGTDVKTVGSSMESLNLKDLQGGLENRIAVRSRVPAVILGIREGLSGSSLNAGNYSSARRMFADGWFAPTAESLCSALEQIVSPPAGSELSHDPAAILFLQDDMKDSADVQATQSSAMRQLIDGGFDPVSVVAAISSNDMTKLSHTGNVSVQLQPAGSETLDQEPVVEARDAAPSFTVNLPEQRNHFTVMPGEPGEAAQVTVVNEIVERERPAPVVNIDAPVSVEVPEQRAEPAQVVVNVDPTPVVIENQNEVTVDTPPAQVTVVPDDKRARFRVARDNAGRINEVVETES